MRTAVSILLLFLAVPAMAGDLMGKVTFRGTAPARTRLNVGSDARCSAQHKQPLLSEDIVVNPNGTLRNVLVSVSGGLPRRAFPVPSAAVVLDQRGCSYAPHVVGVMAGQELEVRNSDPTLHNVHSLATVNPAFNIAQPKAGMHTTRRFEKAETFKLKCEVHPWMSAFVGVFDHPFFAVTGDDGTFHISGLPPGTYTLQAWHERYGTKTVSVTVPSSGSASVTFTYER